MKNPKCNYCNEESHFVDSSIIYGKSYGMIYYCEICGSYVGVHKGTKKPLGSLANKETREWRKKAHNCFDPLWRNKNNEISRSEIYCFLAKYMGIKKSEAHIGQFNKEQCKKVIEFSSIKEKELNKENENV